jgi:hypothetical protein
MKGEKMLERFLEALDEGREYDFISNYYSEMLKSDLRTILLEYIYATHNLPQTHREQVIDDVREGIEEATCKI